MHYSKPFLATQTFLKYAVIDYLNQLNMPLEDSQSDHDLFIQLCAVHGLASNQALANKLLVCTSIVASPTELIASIIKVLHTLTT